MEITSFYRIAISCLTLEAVLGWCSTKLDMLQKLALYVVLKHSSFGPLEYFYALKKYSFSFWWKIMMIIIITDDNNFQ